MLETSGLGQGASNRVLLLLAAFQASPHRVSGSTSAHCVLQISQQLLACLLRNASPESPGALLTQKSSNLKTSGTKQDGPSFKGCTLLPDPANEVKAQDNTQLCLPTVLPPAKQ